MISKIKKGMTRQKRRISRGYNKRKLKTEVPFLSEYFDDFMLTNWCRPLQYDQEAFCTLEVTARKPKLAMIKKKGGVKRSKEKNNGIFLKGPHDTALGI